MAKNSMSRPDRSDKQAHNPPAPAPEPRGKTKHTKDKAEPYINGIGALGQMDFYRGRPIPSDVVSAIDASSVRGDPENDILAADREDL